MQQPELAAFVQVHHFKKDIPVVLAGGAAVSLYTDNQYVSIDIDLVCLYHVDRARLDKVLQELGFKEKGGHFVHPDTRYIIEFPPGPLSIGDQPVRHIREIK